MQLSNNKIGLERELSTRRETSMPTSRTLDVIADAMAAGTALDAPSLHAGYTYLGQFISHEIVRVTNPPPGPPPHLASPFLDLDSIYGATPEEAPQLVNEKFVTGANDLQRKNGIAQIPDARNDDNVIISQLHLFMQRFHNFTIDKRFARTAAEARTLVTLVFQLVVVEDYLRQILAPAVFDSYFRYDRRWLGFEPTKVPLDFSHAGFRFGHSMVRPTYQGFPRHPLSDVPLGDLFQGGHDLPRTLVIDWHRFFGWPGIAESPPTTTNPAQNASRIDHVVAPAMREIHTPNGPIDIVRKNLDAGVTAALPTGTRYIDQLLSGNNGRAIQAALALAPLQDLSAAKKFRDAGLRVEDLPLWPYILVEAWHASRGQHLGVLGSMICAEALANAIAGAKPSIYRGRWPSTDEVLTGLRALGEALQDVRRSAAARSRPAFTDRTFCMRHLIDLVLGPNPTT
jgi:hypothetical protein